MMTPELVAARARAELARAELQASVRDLQAKLRPANLAEEAVDGLKRKGEDIRRKGEELADETVRVARRNPVVAASAAAGIATLLGVSVLLRRKSEDDGD